MASCQLEAEFWTSETHAPGRSASIYDALAGRARPCFNNMHTDILEEGLRGSKSSDEILLKVPSVSTYNLAVPFLDHPELPDDRLLIAIHYYVGEFCRTKNPDLILKLKDSMLLSLGIIMEEELEKLLGPTGHLYYAEGLSDADSDGYEDDNGEDDDREPVNPSSEESVEDIASIPKEPGSRRFSANRNASHSSLTELSSSEPPFKKQHLTAAAAEVKQETHRPQAPLRGTSERDIAGEGATEIDYPLWDHESSNDEWEDVPE